MSLTTFLWQSNLALLLLYVVYWVFLRRDTFFRWNRLYLLVALVFAVVFPLLPVPTLFQGAVPEDQVLLLFGEQEAVSQVNTVEAVDNSPTLLTWENALLAVYLIGVVFLAIRLIISLFKIFKLIFSYTNPLLAFSTTNREWKGYFIVQTKAETPIFSFLNVLFWNENPNISEEEKAKILAHELVHIRQWHSLDVLFVEILTIVFWYNPIIWAYRKSLQAVHEYLADAKVVIKGMSKTEYANLLVSQFLQTDTLYLTNSFFNKSLLKNRITMIYKSKSQKTAMLKYGFVVPMLACCLLVAACSEKITSELITNENAPIYAHQNNGNPVITIDLNKFAQTDMQNSEEDDYWFTKTLKKGVSVKDIEKLQLEVLKHPYPLSKPLEILLARGVRVVGATQRRENSSQIDWKRFAENAQAGDRFIIELRPEGRIFQYPEAVAKEKLENAIKYMWETGRADGGFSNENLEATEREMREYASEFMKIGVVFIIPIH